MNLYNVFKERSIVLVLVHCDVFIDSPIILSFLTYHAMKTLESIPEVICMVGLKTFLNTGIYISVEHNFEKRKI